MCRSPRFAAHGRVSLPWRRVSTIFLAAIECNSVIINAEEDAHAHVDLPLCEKRRIDEVDRTHSTREHEARSSACQGKRNAQQGGIDGSCSLENFDVDRQIDQGVESANGADVACFGSFDAQILGLTVDTFAGGALGVDDVIEGTLSIQGHAHQATGFLVDVLDTAFLFAKLLMVTGLLRRLRKEQGTAIALGAVAVGMLELVRGVHA